MTKNEKNDIAGKMYFFGIPKICRNHGYNHDENMVVFCAENIVKT